MNNIIKTSHTLNSTPEKVWETIRKGSGVHDWLSIITSCQLEGNKRICATEQGHLKETILKIDDDNKIFKYAIDEQPLLPIHNVVATMQVHSKNNSTELTWDIHFDIEDDSQLQGVEQAIHSLYQDGAAGLEKISQ